MNEFKFFLAHYYDKSKEQYVPYGYMNVAQNVYMNAESEETVADAIAQLQSAKTYTLSELWTHTGNSGIHVTEGQIQSLTATVNGFTSHADNAGIHVLPTDKAAWSAGTGIAAEAREFAVEAAAKVNQYESRIARLEDGLFNDITGNPFLVTFDGLTGIVVTKGVWNRERQRIEC